MVNKRKQFVDMLANETMSPLFLFLHPLHDRLLKPSDIKNSRHLFELLSMIWGGLKLFHTSKSFDLALLLTYVFVIPKIMQLGT